MKKNPGKVFEDDFKASVPKGVYFLRLHDSAIGFDVNHSTQRFSLQSPYDVVLCDHGQMYAIELKSHKGKSIGFEGKTAHIKRRQIENLVKAESAGAIAGVVINFRDYAETYFVPATKFLAFMDSCGKSSVNIDDVRTMGVRLTETKKKVHSRYDIQAILDLAS